jgi:hypothetical protein
MHFNKPGDFEINIKKDEAEIILPDVCKYDLGWFQTKYRVVSDLREYAGINTVKFLEVYVKKKEEDTKEETKKEETLAEDKKVEEKVDEEISADSQADEPVEKSKIKESETEEE